jgi:hypothetical protein
MKYLVGMSDSSYFMSNSFMSNSNQVLYDALLFSAVLDEYPRSYYLNKVFDLRLLLIL